MPENLERRSETVGSANPSSLTFSDLLADHMHERPALVEDLGRSFAHSLIQAPAEGIAQLWDGGVGGPTQKAVHFIDAPVPAEFGSQRWITQQVGGALGALAPVLVLHKGVGCLMRRNATARAGLTMTEHMEVLTIRQKAGATLLKMTESGITGSVYAGIAHPVKSEDGDFMQARLRNAAVGGLTFSTLSGSGLGLKALGQGRTSLLGRVLQSEVGTVVISGLPAGLVAANSESLLRGKGLAGTREQTESVLTFAVMGGGFAWGKAKLEAIAPPVRRGNQPTVRFDKEGKPLDVDGRPLEAQFRQGATARFEDYSPAELGKARAQTLAELAEIKGPQTGTSVLDQFRNSSLSMEQKYRVLSSLAEVREHFVNTRPNGKADPDQQGNWFHTQGEFGRVLDSARANKLTPIQTEDAALASMFADAVKSKQNFLTHHLDGALAADHVLGKYLGGNFTRARLDGISNAIREHQIGPPEFMAQIYGGRIRNGIVQARGSLTQQEELALSSLQKKMADPLNAPTYRTSDGATALKLSPEERALLNSVGVPEWYVPEGKNPWNPASRSVIDGDTLDNYYTPGGIGKITSLRGPEAEAWVKDRRLDTPERGTGHDTNIGSARHSAVDAGKLLTAEGKKLAENARLSTEQSIERAHTSLGDWLRKEKGLDPDKAEIPFVNADLKYPLRPPGLENEWWRIHRLPADKRSADEQALYARHRLDGLDPTQQSQFLLAKEARERMVNELRKAQRVSGDAPPEYKPSARPSGSKK